MWSNNGNPPPIIVSKAKNKKKSYLQHFDDVACITFGVFICILMLAAESDLKGAFPQPATAVKILGPRSRAGLMGNPQLYP